MGQEIKTRDKKKGKMAITTYADLVKRNQSGANSNPSYSPYRDKIDNGVRDGSTQYAPSSQYTPATPTPTQSTPAQSATTTPSSGFDIKDRNANPGDNYFWDSADGWKLINNVSSDYDAQLEAARKAEEERQARVRSAINAGYDAVDAGLNDLAGRLPTQAQEQNEQISSLYGTSSEKLNNARSYANDQIDANQKTTLNDLSDRLRASLQAANTYLGAAGASNSSANERYSTALLKQANKQQGNVMTQADSQRAAVQKTYDDNMAQLQEWQSSKLYEVKQWLTDQQNQIEREKMTASSERAQALANLEENLHQVAMQRVQDIESQANAWKNSVNAWVLEQQGNIANGVNLLGQTPQALSYENFGNWQMGNQITTPTLRANYNSGSDDDKAGTSRITM